MVTRRSLLAAAPAAAAGALALSSCGGSGGGGKGNSHETLTWMSMLHTPVTPDPAGPIQKKLEENTGQKFSIQWVPDASKEEKINAALASDKIADITTLNQLAMPSIRQPLKSGMFWEVEPLLKDFDNLKGIDQNILELAKIDGKLYGVPMQSTVARYGVLVRKDWLDTLGMDVPHTIDDLAEVALAFATEDVEGKGKATGFIDREESFNVGFPQLAGYFGAGETFEEQDGKIVPTFATDAWKEAMTWYRDLHEKGAVNKEFITMQKTNQEDAIVQGKGGIVVTGLFGAANYLDKARSNDKDTTMKWAMINDMTYKDVPRRIVSDTGGGMGGLLGLSSDAFKDEDEARVALKFIDALMDVDNYSLMTNGIEGRHFELKDDDVVEVIDRDLSDQEVRPYVSSRPSQNPPKDGPHYRSSDELKNTSDDLIEENAKYAVTNPTQALTSEAYDSSWGQIEQNVQDAYNKFMSGQLDMSGYEKVIEAQNGQGLDKILEEFTAGYENLDH
jgi:putative aldouronate transport system substrate-binding protein